ncbi:MAG TPA: patatin-like phospholipase family protein [Actinomycetota bacterium]|nr:patatin-like phospholipase family protein [Actinomycetota bacterium]
MIPATLLADLEARSGRHAFEMFDLLVGTSTGCILALALTCPQATGTPRSANEIRKLYLERGGSIFPLGGMPLARMPRSVSDAALGYRSPLPPGATLGDKMKRFMGTGNIRKVFAPFGGDRSQGNARYPPGPLEHELQEQFGSVLMSHALRPVIGVSCDFATQKPLIFRGGGLTQGELGDAQMWHVARASSAGPTFFPPFRYRDTVGVSHECVDGGLVANDPAIVGLTEALAMRQLDPRRQDEILLVSIGTGHKAGRQPEMDDVVQLADQRTWLQIAPRLAGTLSSAGGELLREQLSRAMGSRYVRLQTTLEFGAMHAMDNVSPANLEALRQTGEHLVQASRAKIDKLLPMLAA